MSVEIVSEASSRITVGQALAALVQHPVRTLVYRWNWKSALFSAVMRAPIFFSANLSGGLREATGAMLAECVFRALIAGFWAACTQALRNAEPAWAAVLTLTVALPFVAHVLEFLLHWLRATHNLRGSIVGSVIFTVVSTLFNWYAMRDGVLIVGSEGNTLASDLARMPRVIWGFVSWPIRVLWRMRRATGSSLP